MSDDFFKRLEALADTREAAAEGRTESTNLILLIHQFDNSWAVYWDLDEPTLEYVQDVCSFDVAGMNVDALMSSTDFTGVLVGKASWENQGPSDWPGGGNEHGVEIIDLRPATAEEWRAFCKGDHPF